MRIDKFLKVSRLLKRRTLAAEACDGGRVSVNGRSVKPSYNIKVGDVVEIGFNSGAVKFEVLLIKETVRKEEAENLYRIIKKTPAEFYLPVFLFFKECGYLLLRSRLSSLRTRWRTGLRRYGVFPKGACKFLTVRDRRPWSGEVRR